MAELPLDVSDEDPAEPADDLSLDVSEVEPLLPIDPEEPDDPGELLDCAPAGSAMSRLAIPSPATIPFPIFM